MAAAVVRSWLEGSNPPAAAVEVWLGGLTSHRRRRWRVSFFQQLAKRLRPLELYRDSVHGGVLMAFADYTLCMGANMGQSESVVTMTCNNEFVAPAYKNDIVEGECEIVRRGKSTVFCRCTLRVSGNVVLTGSAVIKRVKNR